MKKLIRIMIIVGIFTFCIIVGTNSSETVEESNKVVRLRLAETGSERQPSAMGASYFCQLVREKSKGRIKIEILYSDADCSDILEQVKYGGLSFACVNALDVMDQVPELETEFQFYAYESPEQIIDWTVVYKDKIMEAFESISMEPLIWYYPEKRCFYSSSNRIANLNDFKNLKIKTCDTRFMNSSMNALGATAVYVNNDDIYKSLKSGYMDAGEASFSEFVLGDYFDMVDYVTISNYISSPDMIIASDVVMEELSEEDRELIRQCARETYHYEKEQVQLFQEEYLFRVGTKKKLFLETEEFSGQLQEVLKHNVRYEEK